MQSLTLQVLWLDDSLGLAVNQKVANDNLVPLTPYYFWPISEAWEQIRFELDSKPWIPKEDRIRLLNLVVKAMNEWQDSRRHNGTSKMDPYLIKEFGATDNISIVGIT